MTKFNNITVIKRENRPSPISPCLLDFFWVKDGYYQDPYQVCSVYVFPNTQFGAPDAYVDLSPGSPNYGLVNAISGQNYIFHNVPSGQTEFNADVSACASESDYLQENTASSIYKVKEGHFSVILQPSAQYWTSAYNEYSAVNSASSVRDYIDIWTLVDVKGSKAQIYVNTFRLNAGAAFAVTEPVEITPRNELVQRYVDVGTKLKLRVKTFLHVDNEPLAQSLRDIINTGALLTDAELRITKINESPNLTSRVIIRDFADTADDVYVNHHNTISLLWDTANIAPKYSEDILGGPRGVYEIEAKYNVLDETFYSPKFKLIVR